VILDNSAFVLHDRKQSTANYITYPVSYLTCPQTSAVPFSCYELTYSNEIGHANMKNKCRYFVVGSENIECRYEEINDQR
jgi:hypothetical protein